MGETLTADTSGIADADGLTNATFSYQWLADDTAITNASASTYTLTSGEQGKAIKVRVTFTDDGGNEESLTSAGTEALAAANSPATGTPTISGTAQAGETLTATTPDIGDDDGLSGAVFAYQWIRRDPATATEADIDGATGTTYTVTAEDVGKAIKVRVTFTDDAGNEESLTSSATGVVAAALSPLTAEASQVPASHDGDHSFTFELRFSEEPKTSFSYKTLRDHAFSVTGGEVVNARRLNAPSNVGWEITVQPFGDDDVTVSLPVTTDCDSQGAVCTGDERKLSGAIEITVAGPGEQQVTNSPATGAPTISGTAQVGETLTASTSGIADADGLTNATFAYRWLADGAEISGATGSTYTLAASEQGKAIKVRVNFSDDAGNEETLTSAGTGAVAAAPSPLTAQASQVPASHDGNDSFTFELRFSEEPEDDFSYKTLRDHAFTMTGGEVINARRLNPPSNVGWEIIVQPDADGTVVIVLPVTADCAAEGAVCTEDGRMLSNRLELTVSGP